MNEGKSNQSRPSLSEVVRGNLRAYMAARGLKQYWLAEFKGMVQATISNCLSGRSTPTVRTIEAYAEALDVKPKCVTCRDEDTRCHTCTPDRRPPRVPVPE